MLAYRRLVSYLFVITSFFLLSGAGVAEEDFQRKVLIDDPEMGYFGGEALKEANHIPKAVKEAVTYRIVPLFGEVIWIPKEEHAKLEAEGGFLGELFAEFRESFEDGTLKDDIRYVTVYPLIEQQKDANKGKVPVVFSGTASGSVIMGQNMLWTVRHVFQDHVDGFSMVNKIYEEIEKVREQRHEKLRQVQKQVFEESGAAEKYRNAPPEARKKFDALIAEKNKELLKAIDDELDEGKKWATRSALKTLWSFDARFILYDKDGNIVYAPDGKKRKAHISYAINPDVVRAKRYLLPNPKLEVEGFVSEGTSELEQVLDFLTDSSMNVIILSVEGVKLADPLPLAKEEIALDSKVYIKGYPDTAVVHKDKARDSDGIQEYVSPGKIVGGEAYVDVIQELLSKGKADKKKLAELDEYNDTFTKFFTVSDAVAIHGNSGGPILNEKGEVVGITDRITTSEPHLTFGPSIPSTLQFMRLYSLLKKDVKNTKSLKDVKKSGFLNK